MNREMKDKLENFFRVTLPDILDRLDRLESGVDMQATVEINEEGRVEVKPKKKAPKKKAE